MRNAFVRLAATAGAVTLASALGTVMAAAPASAATTSHSMAATAAPGTTVRSDDDCRCHHENSSESDDWTHRTHCDDEDEGLLGGILDNVLDVL